jgi:hypothetical protein
MQSKAARPIQGSVNLANLGLQEFRLVRGLGAGQALTLKQVNRLVAKASSSQNREFPAQVDLKNPYQRGS